MLLKEGGTIMHTFGYSTSSLPWLPNFGCMSNILQFRELSCELRWPNTHLGCQNTGNTYSEAYWAILFLFIEQKTLSHEGAVGFAHVKILRTTGVISLGITDWPQERLFWGAVCNPNHLCLWLVHNMMISTVSFCVYSFTSFFRSGRIGRSARSL